MARASAPLAAVLALLPSPSTAADGLQDARLCVPVARFDFNPFRAIDDGKELAYLLFTRPFISTNPEEQGVLSQYEFSPDGRLFQARVNESMRWGDGTPLSARDAALCIAEGLRNRPIGQRVRVADGGLRLLDDRTFELRFESQIDNVTGAVREALSTNSRQNRIWAVRIKKIGPDRRPVPMDPPEVIGRHPLAYREGRPGWLVGPHFIRLAGQDECEGAEFGSSREALGPDLAGYAAAISPRAQAVTFQPNTLRLNLAERESLSSWIRAEVSRASDSLGLTPVPGFFLAGEPGFRAASAWPSNGTWGLDRNRTIRLGVEAPLLRSLIREAADREGLKIEIVDLPLKTPDVDGQLLASAVQDGRQIILQDLLEWRFVGELMTDAPLTRESLRRIAERSASTIPPDAETLQDFERKARREFALVPLARRHPRAYSKRTAPLSLEWLKSGEPVFRLR